MRTYSVSLSDPDVAALEAVAARHVGVSPHMVHVALLRIACRGTDAAALQDELGRIQAERRESRRKGNTPESSEIGFPPGDRS